MPRQKTDAGFSMTGASSAADPSRGSTDAPRKPKAASKQATHGKQAVAATPVLEPPVLEPQCREDDLEMLHARFLGSVQALPLRRRA